MSTKIMISVNYEDIPSEVNTILERPITNLHFVLKALEASKKVEDPKEKLEILDGLRKKLVIVDLNIEDAYQILLSYTKNELEKMQSSGEKTKDE